jgi:hypothetical protein
LKKRAEQTGLIAESSIDILVENFSPDELALENENIKASLLTQRSPLRPAKFATIAANSTTLTA